MDKIPTDDKSSVTPRSLSRFAYVFFADGKPVAHGFASNNFGEKIRIDESGRFAISPDWPPSPLLYFSDSMGNPVGCVRLIELPNGEFAPLTLQYQKTEFKIISFGKAIATNFWNWLVALVIALIKYLL